MPEETLNEAIQKTNFYSLLKQQNEISFRD